MTSGWVAVLLAARFATELMLLAAVAVVGASLGQQVVTSALLAVAGVLLVATVWGLLVAPRAARRLPDRGRLVLELVLFVGASVALVGVGHRSAAAVLFVLSVACALLVRRFAKGQ